MTDILNYCRLKYSNLNLFLTKVAVVASVSTAVLVEPLYAAEQEWWFDVEVILFERNLDINDVPERFDQTQLTIPNGQNVDLLTSYLMPNIDYLLAGLPFCTESKKASVQKQYEEDFAFPQPAETPNEQPITDDSTQIDDVNVTENRDLNSNENQDSNKDESFQYEVATTDIFAKPEAETSTLDQADSLATKNVEAQLTETSDLALVGDEPHQTPNEVSINKPLQMEFNTIEWQVPTELPCAYAAQIEPSFAAINAENDKQSLALVESVPVQVEGIEKQMRSPFLLPSSAHQMADLFDSIKKQSGITPLLHVSWRQEVKFGRDKAQTFRLFAGKNFAQQFDAQGLAIVSDTDTLFETLIEKPTQPYIPKEERARLTTKEIEELSALLAPKVLNENVLTDDLFTKITKALADESSIDVNKNTLIKEELKDKQNMDDVLEQIWQIDGGVKVYLRNVGRVPYLHIDSNLDYRQPVFDPKQQASIKQSAVVGSEPLAIPDYSFNQPNYLQSVNFNQLRRVISKQVHYFDHPLFGMIVRINRYRWPVTEKPADTTGNQE